MIPTYQEMGWPRYTTLPIQVLSKLRGKLKTKKETKTSVWLLVKVNTKIQFRVRGTVGY